MLSQQHNQALTQLVNVHSTAFTILHFKMFKMGTADKYWARMSTKWHFPLLKHYWKTVIVTRLIETIGELTQTRVVVVNLRCGKMQ